MITIIGDLIADFSLRVDHFPIEARSLMRAEYLELGPGGASKVQKRGMGHNVPTLDEVRQLLIRFGKEPGRLLP